MIMSNYDTDILIQNIKSLMDNKGITQSKLANILGMSQSNVSKALSESDKKSFTLDQVVGIAKHFHVSIDLLVGNRHTATIATSPRGIATFLSEIIASHDAKYFTIEKEETVYELDDYSYPPRQECNGTNRKIIYPAVYFPSYWNISDYAPNEAEAYAEATQCGNDTRMLPVNEFLHHFKEIFDIYEKGDLSEETYKVVLSDMLNRLRDH